MSHVVCSVEYGQLPGAVRAANGRMGEQMFMTLRSQGDPLSSQMH